MNQSGNIKSKLKDIADQINSTIRELPSPSLSNHNAFLCEFNSSEKRIVLSVF